jgi:hypothetical protein
MHDPPTADQLEHVKQVIDSMLSGRQRWGEHKKLAVEWGTTEAYAKRVCQEASRFLSMVRGPLRDDVERKMQEIEEIQALAMRKEKHYVTRDGTEHAVPDPDYRAAIDAARLYLQVRGALVPKRAEADSEVEDTGLRQALVAELRANPELARSIFAQLGDKEIIEALQDTKELPCSKNTTH